MTQTHAQSLIDQLDNLLEQERDALLHGRLEEMATIADEKERLIDALNAIGNENGDDMSGLQSKVARNQILLDGALEGIRNVASRLAALRKIRRTLETYDATGRKQTIQGEVERKVERRA